MAKLTEKQKRFCDEYLIDLNATQAAIRAGYSEKTAYRTGADNLKKPQIRKYITERQSTIQRRTEITQDKVVAELAKIGFANVTDFLSVINGRVLIKSTQEMEKDKIGAISGIKSGMNGIEVKLNDKVKALELLGKHLGMFDKSDNNEDALKKLDAILEGIDHAAK